MREASDVVTVSRVNPQTRSVAELFMSLNRTDERQGLVRRDRFGLSDVKAETMTTSNDNSRNHRHYAVGRSCSLSHGVYGLSHLRKPNTAHVPLIDAVGVVSSNAFEAETTATWVRSFGYAARVVDTAGLDRRPVLPRVLLAHGVDALIGIAPLVLSRVRVIVLVDAGAPTRAVGAAKLIVQNSDASQELRLALRYAFGDPSVVPVDMTEREQEVLASYVLGDTVKETAAKYFIAESTVRTHYQRVTQRYEDSGRHVANKAQLLLAMLADGWLRVDGSLGVRRDKRE